MRKKRPLFNMITQFGNVPKEWLNHIEPYVVRGHFLPCWIWTGALDRNGYPHKNIDGKTIMIHRFVARMFYDFPDNWYVTRSCRVQNCVNPGHLVIKATRTRNKA